MANATQQDRHRLLTVRQAARAFAVSDETIRRWADDGTIRGVKIGGVRRVFASEIDRLLQHKETLP